MFSSGHILGINARNQIYSHFNTGRGKRIADSKLLTKRRLARAGLPAPKLLKVFKTRAEALDFDWTKLPESFVVKPVSGYGGGGILIIRKRARLAGEWLLMNNSTVSVADLREHCLDILAGQYSLHNLPDWVMVEERIKIARVFRSYAYQGTPDIRVIVFNKVPVMAMLRLPTIVSAGRANLHQGAVGVGIDLATGITNYGVYHSQQIKYLPGTIKKVNGIRLPHWGSILRLSVKVQETMPDLGYVGVDIVYDKDRGPMVLELNARPGLEIQNANLSPLRKRLERVEGLKVLDAEHGVKIARTLFAERYVDRAMVEEGVKILDVVEKVKIRTSEGQRIPVLARIDTGAFRSSIDSKLAKQLGLLGRKNILWRNKFTYRSANGRQSRPVIALTFWLAGRKIKTSASVADRSRLKLPVLVGRNDLSGFLVRTK